MSSPRKMILSSFASGNHGVPSAVVIEADCGHKCWISVGGMETVLSDADVRTVCMDCVPKGAIDAAWRAGTLRVPEGVERELGDALNNPEVAAAIREYMERNRK